MGIAGKVRDKAREVIETRGRPFSQEATRSGVVSLDEEGSVNRVTDTDRLYELLRKSPEVLSLVQAMVDDIIGNGYEFEYLGETNGERARKDASEFYENHVKEQFANAIFDTLIAGDGYMYLNFITEQEAKAHIYRENKDRFHESKHAAMAAEAVTDELRQETQLMERPRDVQAVPASTVEHKINKFGDILEYNQSIDGGPGTTIQPEKMVHFGYLNLNGGTYNFSPMRSIVSELQILANSKDHNGKIHENAAIVNKLIKMPEEGPESDRYEHVKKTIKKFRQLENKHRDLILTGEIEVEDLNSIGSEMEFRELAEYITRVLVMAWGVPPTRIGMSISGDTGARVTSMTHQGYFKRITRLQDNFVTDLNQGLWEKHFNVRMKLKQPDVQTEIKEAERDLRKTDVAMKRMAAGVFDREAAMDYLDVKPEDRADLSDEEDRAVMELAAQVQSGRDQQLSELEVFGDRADEEMQEDQEEAQ